MLVATGDELKLVYPQAGGDPQQFEHLDFASWRLQPLDDARAVANAEAAVEYCLKNPKWHLSLQTHKQLGIP